MSEPNTSPNSRRSGRSRDDVPGRPEAVAGSGRWRGRAAVALLLILTALVVALGVLSFSRRIQTFQALGVETTLSSGSLQVTAADPGSELRPGDLLVLVNGEQIAGRHELDRQLRRREQSELMVMRQDELVLVRHALPALEIDLPYLLLVLIGVVYLFVGLYTLLRGATRQVVLFHLWCLTSTAVYLLSPVFPFGDALDRLIYAVEEAGRLFLPPLMLHFFLVFPRPALGSGNRGRWLARAVPFLYIPALALLAVHLDLMTTNGSWLATATERNVELLVRLDLYLLILYAAASAVMLVRHLLTTERWEEERQVLWITLGMGVGFVPFLGLYLLPTTVGLSVPQAIQVLAVVPLAVVPLSFAYAILRYRLWDITIIVRDVMTYTLTILLGALGFSLLNLLIRRSIPEDFELTRNLSTLAGGLLIAGMLLPAKQGIGGALQRFHYRGSYSRRRALSQFGHELLHERDLERLSEGLLQELEDCMDLEGCNLYLVDREHLTPVRHETPTLEAATELWVTDFEPEIWQQDFVVFSPPALPETALRSDELLALQGYRCAFPLTVRDRRVGLVLTGLKNGHVPLNSDDSMLIRQLLNQAALAIENAQLLEQMQRQLDEVIELKQFNEEIVESSPAGIAVLDSDRRVVLANLAFAALVGSDRSGLRRRRIDRVLPVDLPPVGGTAVEVPYIDHQDREHLLQLSMASFLGDHTRGMRVLVVHDVTELAAMEKALDEQKRLAALGIMAAGVAHEVNTPLTGISSYAQMLLAKTPEDDPRHAVLQKVERQTFRAARIVNSLLEFARASTPDSEPVDLLEILAESVDLLFAHDRHPGIEIRWPEEQPDKLEVEGNEGELHQVFNNLLLNAIEAMNIETSSSEASNGSAETRWIAFEVETSDDRVAVHVIDNGPGISTDHLGQVLHPFFSTKLDKGGTGLGLSISNEIVRRHGGELVIGNEPGAGSRCTVLLPRRGAGERKTA